MKPSVIIGLVGCIVCLLWGVVLSSLVDPGSLWFLGPAVFGYIFVAIFFFVVLIYQEKKKEKSDESKK